MNILNKNTTLYILILISGIVIISSLIEMMRIENETMRYCGTVDYYGTINPKSLTKKDSLNSKQEEIALLGKELFEGNCAMCHAVNQKVVGPALAGVANRWKNEKQLIEFIQYPEKMIEKNKYVQDLYKEYRQIMPNHDFFDDEQIKAILFHIKYQSGEKVYVEL